MNSVELRQTLVDMSTWVFPMHVINGIIDAIMSHYMTFSGYYPEDAIRTMSMFLRDQIIVW